MRGGASEEGQTAAADHLYLDARTRFPAIALQACDVLVLEALNTKVLPRLDDFQKHWQLHEYL